MDLKTSENKLCIFKWLIATNGELFLNIDFFLKLNQV